MSARGLLGRLRGMVAAAVWAAVGSFLMGTWLFLHTFQAFTGETLVARVTTQRLSEELFELTYQPSDAEPLRIQLRGDQWAISGGVVTWHPWLTLLGLKSYHKPMRLSGQFSDIARQQAQPPTVHQLDPSGDRVWEACYWADPYLPFVETVYGSAAYSYVEPRLVQEVYATLSGYIIKRKPGSS